jgi:hypothetical protein
MFWRTDLALLGPTAVHDERIHSSVQGIRCCPMRFLRTPVAERQHSHWLIATQKRGLEYGCASKIFLARVGGLERLRDEGGAGLSSTVLRGSSCKYGFQLQTTSVKQHG